MGRPVRRRVGRDDGTTVTVFVQSGQQNDSLTTPPAPLAARPTYSVRLRSYIDERSWGPEPAAAFTYHRGQQYSVIAMTRRRLDRRTLRLFRHTEHLRSHASGTTLTTSA